MGTGLMADTHNYFAIPILLCFLTNILTNALHAAAIFFSGPGPLLSRISQRNGELASSLSS